MKIRYGNMWDVYDDYNVLFLITTNSFIKENGALVMGAGIAKQARDRFKGLDLALGRRIVHLGTYGVLLSEHWCKSKLGAFQVKRYFKDNADLDLINYSVGKLEGYIEMLYILEGWGQEIHLNYPAIENGGLKEKDVYPILKSLPDNVTLWKYG